MVSRLLTQDGGPDAEAEGDAQEGGESLEELRVGEIVIIYRVDHLLTNLGWVDLDLGRSLASGPLL